RQCQGEDAVIQIPLLSLIAIASAATSVPAVEVPAAEPILTQVVQDLCLRAAEGETRAEAECLAVIREQADEMLVDEMSPDFQTSCLVIDQLNQSDLIWIYLEWLDRNPDAAGKPASTTINVALVERLPCGWRER